MLSKYKKQLCQAVTSNAKFIVEIRDHYTSKNRNFKEYLRLKTHKQPLTNCGFSKYGDYFATSSYDRTCKIW